MLHVMNIQDPFCLHTQSLTDSRDLSIRGGKKKETLTKEVFLCEVLGT